MRILSISDVITNSSSEVFCTIKSDDELVLQEIFEVLGKDFGKADWGDGGTWLSKEDKSITVDFAYGSFFIGADRLFRPGIEAILKPWEGKYTITYGEE